MLEYSLLGCSLLLASSLRWQSPACAREEPIQVGIYPNPPKVFMDEAEAPSGFFSEVTQAIAAEEGWTIEFVRCEWAECLQALERRELDLMVDVSYSQDRDQRFDFNREVVFPSWSVIYVRRGIELDSILSLDGKRVAVLRDGIQYESLGQVAQDFDIQPQFVRVADYFEMMRLLKAGEVDAGAVNRFSATLFNSRSIRRTNILLKPTQVHFAAPEGEHADLLAAIDRQLADMKSDRNSVYYQAGEQWLGGLDIQTTNWKLIRRAVSVGAAVLLIVFISLIVLWNWTLKREIAERIKAQTKLKHDALHDSLTGLPNRSFLMQRLQQLFQTADTQVPTFALLFLDLDRFKVVNDSLGHLAGDQILIQTAQKLQRAIASSHLTYLPSSHVVARLGGDEFVILLEQCDSKAQAIQVAEHLLQALQQPCVIEDHEAIIGGSIGIVVGSGAGQQPADVIRDADIAMYYAKAQGRHCYAVFNLAMRVKAAGRMQMENDVRHALDAQEFVLYYQPIVDLKSGNLQGFEALLRWQHPSKGLLTPNHFIAIAEETELIVPIGWWALQTACAQLKQWQRQYAAAETLTMSVNVSAAQLQKPDFFQQVNRILNDTGLAGKNLVLEITESMLIEQVEETHSLLKQLQTHAIGISIDDFGTGYSCFSYLHQLPITTLKVDRLFVCQLFDSGKTKKITESIILLAQQIGLKTIAEGIEDEAQLNYLKQLGCSSGQGYWFDRPLDPVVAEWRVKRQPQCYATEPLMETPLEE
jgi:diguanylate cyclase (GGDEF)-like protein